MKKYVFWFFIGLLFAGCQDSSHSQTADEADTTGTDHKASEEAAAQVDAFFESYFEAYVKAHPMLATQLNKTEGASQWDDFSDEAQLQEIQALKEALATLKTFDFEALDEEKQISYRVFEYYANSKIEGEPYIYHNYPINQFNGLQTELPSFLIASHHISNQADAEAYIARVKGLDAVMQQLVAKLKTRAEKGIIPPKFVFPQVKAHCENLLRGEPFEGETIHPIYEDFTKKLTASQLDDASKEKLYAALSAALTTEFKAGYENLLSYWGELEAQATDDMGVWKFPDGENYYKYALKTATTTAMQPEDVFNLGEKEVELAEVQIQEIMRLVEFKNDNIQDFYTFIKTDKQFLYENNEEDRAAYLEKSKEVIASMQDKAGDLFNKLPKANLEVRRVEPFREATANLSFSEPASPDGQKPGIYYVNLYDMKLMPNYMLEAQAYHEGIPGIHLQQSIVQEFSTIPAFRKHLVSIEAYREGWGLYSELLPKQVGFYQDSYSDFGRLALESFRACRLVVDVGLHVKGWTKERAIDYMLKNTPLVREDIEKEVERYIVNPAQSTAYYIGMDKIVTLKNNCAKQMGENFNIKDFHDVILLHGAVPLNLLEDNVNRWMATRQGGKQASL